MPLRNLSIILLWAFDNPLWASLECRAYMDFRVSRQLLTIALLAASSACARRAVPIHDFVQVDGPVIALTHARVIDGTGAPGRPDQAVVITDGHISQIGDSGTISLPSNARIVNLPGRTILPGYVMVHEHLFFTPDGSPENSMRFSFPRLYLAGGATTIRTAGSMGLSADLKLQRAINQHEVPGPTWR